MAVNSYGRGWVLSAGMHGENKNQASHRCSNRAAGRSELVIPDLPSAGEPAAAWSVRWHKGACYRYLRPWGGVSFRLTTLPAAEPRPGG